MIVPRTEVYLHNVARNESEVAELWHDITEQQLADWECAWRPELNSALHRLRLAGVQEREWPQDRHWDWRRKVAALRGMLANPGFSIVCDDMTQGMMIVDTVKYRGRIRGQKGMHLVYVEFVESAPWNRRSLFDLPRYRGVGSILVRAAVTLSEKLEFRGRVGLHSLPQANAFYANHCCMTDLGPDSKYPRLRYFEMTPAQAQAFISKGDRSED